MKTKLKSLLSILPLFVLLVWFGCKKDDSTPAKTVPVLASTVAAGSITSSSASTGGNITASGGSAISARGVCWNKTGSPTIGDKTTSDGSGAGSFSSQINNLDPNTQYFVRSYATNETGTGYGAEVSFSTLEQVGLAIVTTNAVTNVTQTTASSGGNVTSDGGNAVTARGVCWSTAVDPTVAGSKTSNGTSTGTFTSNLAGLTTNTTYHVRAYATNSFGTAYGTDQVFTTSAVTVNLPTLGNTTAASAITSNTANSGGNVTSDGGGTITAKGVCWGTSSNPTIANSKTNEGSGTGLFASSLTGLTGSTQYFARSYATNSAGTAYGTEISFTTAVQLITVTFKVNMINETIDGAGVHIAGSFQSPAWDPGATAMTDEGNNIWSYTTILQPNTTIEYKFINGASWNGKEENLSGACSAGTNRKLDIGTTNQTVTFCYNSCSSSCPNLPHVGDAYQGGIIIHILQVGEQGYDPAVRHGIIAATSNQSTGFGMPWGCAGTDVGSTSTAIGSGQANTNTILNSCGSNNIAAKVCNDLVLNGYSDWYLPSMEELRPMAGMEVQLGIVYSDAFWSSSQASATNGWGIGMQAVGGPEFSADKSLNAKVRAVRSF